MNNMSECNEKDEVFVEESPMEVQNLFSFKFQEDKNWTIYNELMKWMGGWLK